jgi:hypothetical protein
MRTEGDTDCTVEPTLSSSQSHTASSPPLLDSPSGGSSKLPLTLPLSPSATTTSFEEAFNIVSLPWSNTTLPDETSIPIDPVLLALSHPRVATEPLLQPASREALSQQFQWRPAVSPMPDLEDAPAVSNPILPPMAPMSPPVFNNSPTRPQVPDSTLVATPPPIPSDWPKHVVDAYHYLTEETAEIDGETTMRNWGDIWFGCLQAFIAFQQCKGFPNGGQNFPPSTDVRPRKIGVWMKNGRRWKDVELVDKERFSRQWWDWWRSLQPKS